MTVRRIERAVHAVAVKQVRTGIRQINVPDLVGVFRKRDPRLLMTAGSIEQAQLDVLGVSRKNREVDALAVPRGPERAGATRPHLSGRSHQPWGERRPLTQTFSPRAGRGRDPRSGRVRSSTRPSIEG